MNTAEAKCYEEENITIIFMIIISSPSYILQVLHNSRVFLLLNALDTKQDFSGRVHSV